MNRWLLVSVAATVVALAAGLALYQFRDQCLPENVYTHWGPDDKPDSKPTSRDAILPVFLLVPGVMTLFIGLTLVLPWLSPITGLMERLIPNDDRLAVNFHLLFNLALAALFLLNVKRTASLLFRLLRLLRQLGLLLRQLFRLLLRIARLGGIVLLRGELVGQILQRLRRVFLREPFDGLAQALGRSPGSIRVVWTRALRRLRQLLTAGEAESSR